MARHWAKAPMPRDQFALFSPTLDSMIGEDHPVRLLDEILRALDWSAWVVPCSEHAGRPPIHPRILAGIILHGLMQRIRSSRMLEYQCGHNLDFLWLAEADWPKLPRNPQNQLDKSCFVYEEEADRYRCPMGRALEFAGTEKDTRNGQKVEVRLYRSARCEDCPLLTECRAPKSRRNRTIHRDVYEPLREAMAARMRTPEGKAGYAPRMHAAETPFARAKGLLGVRQFLLRGLENVRTEWRWVCTALNGQKLLRAVAALRARLAQWLAEPATWQK
jgi:hypothetical protein